MQPSHGAMSITSTTHIATQRRNSILLELSLARSLSYRLDL